MTPPAGAQSRPSGTPTPVAVDPDSNKHEFNRGESIYAAPDSPRLLKFTIIKSNPAAMQELADLVVRFKALKDDEDKGFYDRAKTRQLAMLKVKFYDKYNRGTALLKVPKAKMPKYLAFWSDFWRRVDQFREKNPGVGGPGPFKLPPSVDRLAALQEGGEKLLANVAQEFAIREAAADWWVDIFAYVKADGYPACGRIDFWVETPVLKCNPYDDDYFYFQHVSSQNYHWKDKWTHPGWEPLYGSRTVKDDYYLNTYKCIFNKEKRRVELSGGVDRDFTVEKTFCGAAAGDNKDELFRESWWDYTGKYAYLNEIKNVTYCLDSNSTAFQVYQKVFSGRYNISEEPDWVCR